MALNLDPEREFRDKLETLKGRCREVGLKLTHQRLEIFRELALATDHPSAEAIHKRVQARLPTISLDTTYRTLSTFERYGFVAKVCVLDDRARFCGDSSLHHHLLCTRCKSIVDFPWDTFDEVQLPPETEGWGRVNTVRVTLEGICTECLKQRDHEIV
ncbi:MAG: transcriptional repressor [Deltaproteobacteria bacterium]|nr:MAG: transcriptional repressor [Deltaproteobacteria bacterium]